jgi:formate dehydrogenase major subunit
MAENHPVGFQWVMEAKRRGATIIHVDPRFTRTSAVSDIFVPLRAGSDIAFLGGLLNYVLSNELDFREYVVAYTNAAAIVSEDFRDTEDLDGMFSGWDPEKGHYDTTSWQYANDEASGDSAAEAETAHDAAGRTRPAPAVPPSARSRSATRRCSTPAASTRCSSGTTRATRRRWWPRSAGSARSSSCRSPRR